MTQLIYWLFTGKVPNSQKFQAKTSKTKHTQNCSESTYHQHQLVALQQFHSRILAKQSEMQSLKK